MWSYNREIAHCLFVLFVRIAAVALLALLLLVTKAEAPCQPFLKMQTTPVLCLIFYDLFFFASSNNTRYSSNSLVKGKVTP
jgi:hypothetical protein